MKHIISGSCPKCREMLFKEPVNPILMDWFTNLQAEQPEVHLAYAYRDKSEQDKFFREGKSKAKWPNSPHNQSPVMALDIFFLVDGKYHLDMNWLKQIADNMPSEMEWGGNWKMKDGPHFEIKNWKNK